MTSTARRRPVALASAAAASLALVAGTAAFSAPPAHAAARIVVGPGVDLQDTLRDLRPGDTLLLRPGRYEQRAGGAGKRAGVIRPALTAATAGAPITVAALDPAHRPLIAAHLKLWGASHWRLDDLRIVTVAAGEDGLSMVGGDGWSVRHVEVSGARKTGAYSNVSIASDEGPGSTGTGAPRNFVFADNCIHDAANVISRGAPTDHNIYVNFHGDDSSGGLITHNTIYGSPHGAGIKLGYGGDPGALGPWGVKVVGNTIADGGYQVVLHGDVRNNSVTGNLFVGATQKFTKLPKTTAVYVHDVVGGGNVFSHNYAYDASMFSWGNRVSIGADNALRADPRVNAHDSCGGYKPRLAAAQAYGRFGTAAFATWATEAARPRARR